MLVNRSFAERRREAFGLPTETLMGDIEAFIGGAEKLTSIPCDENGTRLRGADELN